MSMPKDPGTYLLHNTKLTIKQYKKSVIPSLINAAKYLISTYWQSPEIPMIRDWVKRVELKRSSNHS